MWVSGGGDSRWFPGRVDLERGAEWEGAPGQGKSCGGEGESRPLPGEGCQVCPRVLWALLQEEGKATEMRC